MDDAVARALNLSKRLLANDKDNVWNTYTYHSTSTN
jgi:hypothetical protein